MLLFIYQVEIQLTVVTILYLGFHLDWWLRINLTSSLLCVPSELPFSRLKYGKSYFICLTYFTAITENMPTLQLIISVPQRVFPRSVLFRAFNNRAVKSCRVHMKDFNIRMIRQRDGNDCYETTIWYLQCVYIRRLSRITGPMRGIALHSHLHSHFSSYS